MSERIAGMRGMLPFHPEDVKLKFGKYLNEAALPNIPRAFGHIGNIPPGGDWQMYGNDRYSDCVVAGACHEEMYWAHATRKALPRFTTGSVVQEYMTLTGGQDAGLDPVEVARYRRNQGIADADGKRHQIKAFALIDSVSELEYAVYLYGAAGVGVYLPKSADRQFERHLQWDDLSEPINPAGGHYICIIAKNRFNLFVAVTWGNLQGISADYLKKYCFDAGAGGLAYFSKSYLLENGLSPESINEAQLDDDLSAISNLGVRDA